MKPEPGISQRVLLNHGEKGAVTNHPLWVTITKHLGSVQCTESGAAPSAWISALLQTRAASRGSHTFAGAQAGTPEEGGARAQTKICCLR